MCGYVQPNFEVVLYIVLHSAFQFGDVCFFFLSQCCFDVFEAF